MSKKEEVFQYAKMALAGKNLDSVLNDSFRDAVFQYFSNMGYEDTDIDKIQLFMTKLVDALGKTGIETPTVEQLEDFMYVYTENEDQSNKYIEGIYEGELKFEDSFAKDAMYEDENIRIIHLGTLYYDNNQESVEKYKVVKFAKDGAPATILECYSEINSIEMVDNEEYRKKVEEQLNRRNIKTINCRGYIGTVRKDDKTGEYDVDFDKIALSAVMDYEKSREERKGESR